MNFEKELKYYTSGVTNYETQLNIFLGDRRNTKKDSYVELGKYIVNVFGDDLPQNLSFFSDKVNIERCTKGVRLQYEIERALNVFSDQLNSTYSSIAIFFLTGTIYIEALEKMFGYPLYHDEFGEGFDGEYNEETDEYSEPEIKDSFASYFVEVNGVKIHIGCDHRGTKLEFEKGTSGEDALECCKGLVDIYKDKVK